MTTTATPMPTTATLVFGAADWLPAAAGVATLLLALTVWGYWRAGASRGVRALAFALKSVGVLILVLCLLEPMISGTRARPGANAFVLLADNSQSMTLRDRDGKQSRAEPLKAVTDKATAWVAQLRRDFDVRAYAFDGQLRALADGEPLALDGRASNLGASLDRLVRRYQGRPLAGVLLFTDGAATDAAAVERLLAQHAAAGGTAAGGPAAAGRLPRIYPVLVGSPAAAADVGVSSVAVTQTNFEDAPVTIAADLSASGYKGQTVVAQLLDESGTVKAVEKLTAGSDGEPLSTRFRVRPEKAGVSFYRVRAAAEDQLDQFTAPPDATPDEATLANNARMVAVDRGQGPYRILYVSGRPNWEFKFLQRALTTDDQVQLVGLMRIAKREPKFNFLSRAGEQSNPLFRGFDDPNKQGTGEYDKPVLVRFGTVDEQELRTGFPQTAAELNRYHAVVVDDLEAEFFTQDQLLLLKEFVRQRGGGLLMLGGQESFKNGKFDRTPIGDLLPVYADEVAPTPPEARHRLALTREGWLEPWVRLRPEEDAERQRLATMPPFQTVNRIRGIKPGATVLARATLDDGSAVPALVEQRFGQGRVAALLIGDLWRWGLGRPADTQSDLEKSWRQTVRWLVGEVPKRVEVTTTPREAAATADGRAGGGVGDPAAGDGPDGGMSIAVQVRDPAYAPLENAAVTVRVTAPDGTSLDLPAEPADRQAGRYVATYVPRQPGAYRADVRATAADGGEVGTAAAGWTSDPAADEFRDLKPNRDLLARLAAATGGQVVEPSDIEKFVAALPTKQAEVSDPYVIPAWHTPWVFLLAIACLTAEWGLRRWKGMP